MIFKKEYNKVSRNLNSGQRNQKNIGENLVLERLQEENARHERRRKQIANEQAVAVPRSLIAEEERDQINKVTKPTNKKKKRWRNKTHNGDYIKMTDPARPLLMENVEIASLIVFLNT